MNPENDPTKQESERQQIILQKRRELEQRRADFYANRQQELEHTIQTKEQAQKDKLEKRKALKKQMLRAAQLMKKRD